jgi:hypothetical protein
MHQFRVPFFSASKTASFALLVLLSGFGTAPGQTREHKALPAEELEKYDNPPALLWRTGQSPRMVSQFNAFTSFQVNVDATGHNITGDAANEPSITVDPTNGNKMTIGWRQFNSVASNFRQAGWSYSKNGGATWTFLACSRTMSFAATRSWIRITSEPFSISACSKLSSTTCGAR